MNDKHPFPFHLIRKLPFIFSRLSHVDLGILDSSDIQQFILHFNANKEGRNKKEKENSFCSDSSYLTQQHKEPVTSWVFSCTFDGAIIQ